VDAALDAITSTPPTTVAGMRAVIEYLVELDGHADYLPTLLRSSILRSMVLAAEWIDEASERAAPAALFVCDCDPRHSASSSTACMVIEHKCFSPVLNVW
jgi:hypothetical protein